MRESDRLSTEIQEHTMATTQIMFTADDITVGREFMWNEPGNLTFTVVAVDRDPQAAFAGNRLHPSATVVWSDDKGKESFMSLSAIVNYARTGQII